MTMRSTTAMHASVSSCARNTTAMSFAFMRAVRYFTYCFFYYYFSGKTPQRRHTVAAL